MVITTITILIAVGSLLLLVPRLFGIHSYIVLSGSMEPTIHVGALAFVNHKDCDVEVGDIVTFQIQENNDTLVTHRVISIDEDGYHFKGDANANEDMAVVSKSQIVGTYVFQIPEIGFFLDKLNTDKALAPYNFSLY